MFIASCLPLISAFVNVEEYLDHSQSEVGSCLSISDWFKPQYVPKPSLKHRNIFQVSVTYIFYYLKDRGVSVFLLVALLRGTCKIGAAIVQQ